MRLLPGACQGVVYRIGGVDYGHLGVLPGACQGVGPVAHEGLRRGLLGMGLLETTRVPSDANWEAVYRTAFLAPGWGWGAGYSVGGGVQGTGPRGGGSDGIDCFS